MSFWSSPVLYTYLGRHGLCMVYRLPFSALFGPFHLPSLTLCRNNRGPVTTTESDV